MLVTYDRMIHYSIILREGAIVTPNSVMLLIIHNMVESQKIKIILKSKLNILTAKFNNSFIHSGHFYSALSRPLLLRGAPDYSTDTCIGVSRRSAIQN